jgi:hypothetical protein
VESGGLSLAEASKRATVERRPEFIGGGGAIMKKLLITAVLAIATVLPAAVMAADDACRKPCGFTCCATAIGSNACRSRQRHERQDTVL